MLQLHLLRALINTANPLVMLTFRKDFESFYWLQLEVQAEQIFDSPSLHHLDYRPWWVAQFLETVWPSASNLLVSLFCVLVLQMELFSLSVSKHRAERQCLDLHSLRKYLKEYFFGYECFNAGHRKLAFPLQLFISEYVVTGTLLCDLVQEARNVSHVEMGRLGRSPWKTWTRSWADLVSDTSHPTELPLTLLRLLGEASVPNITLTLLEFSKREAWNLPKPDVLLG